MHATSWADRIPQNEFLGCNRGRSDPIESVQLLHCSTQQFSRALMRANTYRSFEISQNFRSRIVPFSAHLARPSMMTF